MLKTEIICEACNEHFILVNQEDIEPVTCPYCSSPLTVREELDLGEEE